MYPLLSIIIPVYNAEKYISSCLNSILNQTYTNIEIIIVDDGSTDSSLSICNTFSQSDHRIKIYHKINGGQSSARNVGLKIAKGKYITFVDADDEINADVYSSNINYLENNESIDIIQYPCIVSYGTKRAFFRKPASQIISGQYNLFKSWLQDRIITSYMCNKIFRKQLFNNINFHEGIYYEDRHLMCQLLTIASNIYISDIGTYLYYERDNQTTQKTISQKTLQSLICADMNIVKYLLGMNILLNICIKRYFDCYAHYMIMKKNNWALEEIIYKDLIHYKPSIRKILKSNITFFMKIRLIKFYFFT